MIAAIIDLAASRNISAGKRKEIDRKVRRMLKSVYDRFEEYCIARPALTQGDSIELLVDSLQPIIFLFHLLLMEDFEFRVGLGTGDIILEKERADECDGPAFWNAREALDEVKQMKYLSRSAGFRFDKKRSRDETSMVIDSILFLTSFLGLTTTQLQHCYYYIWEKKRISEIAQIRSSSEANVSKSLSKTPCYLLGRVLAFLDEQKMPPVEENS